jgi:hypothetical protein
LTDPPGNLLFSAKSRAPPPGNTVVDAFCGDFLASVGSCGACPIRCPGRLLADGPLLAHFQTLDKVSPDEI